LVSRIEGRKEFEDEGENGAEQDICTLDGGSQMSVEKVAQGTNS
jgi:hypothetical protein